MNELDTTGTDLLKVDSDLSRFRYDDEIDREYSGLGGRIGLLAHLTDTVSLGLTFVTPVELGVDELWYESTRVVYDDGEETSDVLDGNKRLILSVPLRLEQELL